MTDDKLKVGAVRFLGPILLVALIQAACTTTPENIRQPKYLFREETLPMSLDQTEVYIDQIVVTCRTHYILKLFERDPTDPSKASAVVKHVVVDAVVDFEEIDPGHTRIRAYVPPQLFKSSGINSMFDLLLDPCFGETPYPFTGVPDSGENERIRTAWSSWMPQAETQRCSLPALPLSC